MADIEKLISSINKSMAVKPKYCEECISYFSGQCRREEENPVPVSPVFSCAQFERREVQGGRSKGYDLDTRQNWQFWTRVKSGW